MRTIKVTAVEVPVILAAIEAGKSLWIVRDAPICDDRRHYILRPSSHNPLGTRRYDVHDDIRCANPCGNAPDGSRRLHIPPAEFVQACAPCGTCGDGRHFAICNECGAMATGLHCPNCGGGCSDTGCTDCRIELVGPCPECGGTESNDCDQFCGRCAPTGTVTLGHAYAVGQPLPIVTPRGWADSEGVVLVIWPDGHCLIMNDDEVSGEGFRLAHYGPPETLVKTPHFAIELGVLCERVSDIPVRIAE